MTFGGRPTLGFTTSRVSPSNAAQKTDCCRLAKAGFIENFKKITEALQNMNTEFTNLASSDIKSLIKLANDLDSKGESELASSIDNILFKYLGDK